MYNLSDLLKAKHDLNNLNVEELSISTDPKLVELVNILSKFDTLVNIKHAKADLASLDKLLNDANNILKRIIKLSHEFNEKLTTNEARSRTATFNKIENGHDFLNHPDDAIYLDHRKKWAVSKAINNTVAGLIGRYVDFKYPIAYVEPNTGSLFRYLVAGDPFYIIDDRELPYNQALEVLPKETKNKVFRYTRADALEHLEPNSIGVIISWQNFPFKRIADVRNDIKLMSKLSIPGGYIMFDYVDSNDYKVAKAIEDGLFFFQQKEQIYDIVKNAGLEVVHDIEFLDFMPRLLICKKPGVLPTLNLSNKLGLVVPDLNILDKKRQQETDINRYYKMLTSQTDNDLRQMQARDVLMNELDEKRRIDPQAITEQKLKSALNNLAVLLNELAPEHPAVIKSVLNISKLTHNIGRIKDSKNILKRISKDINKLPANDALVKEYNDWLNYLNNN